MGPRFCGDDGTWFVSRIEYQSFSAMNFRISAHWRFTSLGASPACGASAWMALDTASSRRTLTASSRVRTPFLTRARNSATVAVSAAMVYAASSNAFMSRFLVMVQTAARISHHLPRSTRQDASARSKAVRRRGGDWLHLETTTTEGWCPRSVIAIDRQSGESPAFRGAFCRSLAGGVATGVTFGPAPQAAGQREISPAPYEVAPRPGERMDGHGGGPAVPIAESRKDQRQAPSPERSPTPTRPPPRAGLARYL